MAVKISFFFFFFCFFPATAVVYFKVERTDVIMHQIPDCVSFPFCIRGVHRNICRDKLVIFLSTELSIKMDFFLYRACWLIFPQLYPWEQYVCKFLFPSDCNWLPFITNLSFYLIIHVTISFCLKKWSTQFLQAFEGPYWSTESFLDGAL